MPSLSDLEYFFSSRQRPTTHHFYELRMEPKRCWEEQQDRGGMNFDSLDMVYSERSRQIVRHSINLKLAPDQSFSIASVTDLQLEGRLKR